VGLEERTVGDASSKAHRLLASHRWWKRPRDPGDIGLVASLHPWETGMDNSPAWDSALARVPTETTTAVVPRDTMHVDAAMRPQEEEYLRFIHLVDLFRDMGWEPARTLVPASPADGPLCDLRHDRREWARRVVSGH
jgi:hypothetical protein